MFMGKQSTYLAKSVLGGEFRATLRDKWFKVLGLMPNKYPVLQFPYTAQSEIEGLFAFHKGPMQNFLKVKVFKP